MRETKNSGIPWIGVIPTSWKLYKMKHLGQYVNGYPFKPDDWGDTGRPIIRIQDLTGTNKEPNYYSGTIDDKYLVTDGDILVSWAATLDAFEWNQGEGWLNQHIFKAIPDVELVDRTFFIWLLKTAMTYMNDDNKHGIVMQHVTLPVFNNFVVPLPNIEEQKAVAVALRRDVEKVDSLIMNQEAQIEKLKQYRQSLINEVITKGVDSSKNQKDSGIDWLGSIPEHWDIKRGKELFRESDLRSTDGTEELLTVSQYTGITPRSQKNVTMFEALTLEGYKICEIGDIAANTMWLWAGAIGVSEYVGVISPSYNVYRQTSSRYNPKYLDYLLRAPMLVQKYASLSTGIRASRLRLYPKDFLNIMFPIPPLDEQAAIVELLNSRVGKVDKLIEIKQAKIERLQQYKKSLIYEYVTGKKEVV